MPASDQPRARWVLPWKSAVEHHQPLWCEQDVGDTTPQRPRAVRESGIPTGRGERSQDLPVPEREWLARFALRADSGTCCRRAADCRRVHAAIMLTVSSWAQTSRLGDVVARLDGYLGATDQLANIVAEGTYRQWIEQGPKRRRSTTSRILRSDFTDAASARQLGRVSRHIRSGRCSGARPRRTSAATLE